MHQVSPQDERRAFSTVCVYVYTQDLVVEYGGIPGIAPLTLQALPGGEPCNWYDTNIPGTAVIRFQ